MVVTLFGCRKEVFVPSGGLEGWTTMTHSNSASPNYGVVFDQNKVHRIDIVLTTEEYETMQADLADLIGSTGGGGGPGGGGPGGGGPPSDLDETPVYVAADFYYNGIQ